MEKDFKKIVSKLVSEAVGDSDFDESSAEALIEKPQNDFGDYAFPCFSLAKILKKNPLEIASQIAEKISENENVSKIEAKGAYVNFFIKDELITSQTINEILKNKDDYGRSTIGENKKILIEYPSPNTNKPLHLGHVRNMLLGQSLSLILKLSGFKVFEVNLNNDRGIHICKAMLAYKKFGNGKQPDKKTDHFVGDYYVLFQKKSEDTPGLEDQAQQMLVKWESGDKETLELWKKINGWALQGFKKTYGTFGIKHDKSYNESDHYKGGKEIVLQAHKKGLLEKDDKENIVINLEKFGLPNKILLRSDGTSIYMTQDINLAKIKAEDFGMDKSIYVVGSEQIMHFRQLFQILKILKISRAETYHLAHGMVYLPGGRMKSREGKVVDADNLVEEMEQLAYSETKKRYENLQEEELKKRSSQIGRASLKFFILRYDPLKDFTFNPENSLSFEGETGPYVQYVHARICSIFEKHGKEISEKADLQLLSSREEQNLIRLLAQFPQKVEEAAAQYKPLIICRYALDLSQSFNIFYHQRSILQSDEETKKARLLLAECVRQVIKNALSLLSIESPEKM